ncbi:hypothetical protein V8C43DRAFT_284249 [Trichoderma afarasin]
MTHKRRTKTQGSREFFPWALILTVLSSCCSILLQVDSACQIACFFWDGLVSRDEQQAGQVKISIDGLMQGRQKIPQELGVLRSPKADVEGDLLGKLVRLGAKSCHQ